MRRILLLFLFGGGASVCTATASAAVIHVPAGEWHHAARAQRRGPLICVKLSDGTRGLPGKAVTTDRRGLCWQEAGH